MDLNWKNKVRPRPCASTDFCTACINVDVKPPKMIHVPAQRKARYLFFISSDEFTHLKYFHI